MKLILTFVFTSFIFGTFTSAVGETTSCPSSQEWTCTEPTKCPHLELVVKYKQTINCNNETNIQICCPSNDDPVELILSYKRNKTRTRNQSIKRTAKACNKFKNTIVNWTCQDIHTCTQIDKLTSSNLQVRCNPNDENPMKICCPAVTNQTYFTNVSINISEPDIETKVKLPDEDIPLFVEQKCKEYARYRYVNETQAPLLLGQKPFVSSRLVCVETESLVFENSRVDEKEFPHMAALGYGDDYNNITWSCSGSLINEKFILSAANCIVRSFLGAVKWAAIGVIDLADITPYKYNTNLFKIVKCYKHPNYVSSSLNNDIALFELEKPVTFSPTIRPVCLLTNSNIPQTVGNLVTVSGWGKQNEQSQVLLKAEIALRKDVLCKNKYSKNTFMKEYNSQTMICAGSEEDNRETCNGDSGEPLQVPMQGTPCMWTQIGLTSFNSADCKPPGIYTKISAFLPWIQQIAWP